MHELSICGAIAAIVDRNADGRPVTNIYLQIGQLRQIVPDTLIYCWSVVTSDTPLDGSSLVVEHVPARLDCLDCGHVSEVGGPPLACRDCSGSAVRVVAGDECLVTSLDLVEV